MISLRFETCFQFDFPEPSEAVNPPLLSATALTIGRHESFDVLWFLTQSQFDDYLVAVDPLTGAERGRLITPPGRHVISGLGYDLRGDRLLACQKTTGWNETFLINPHTGQEMGALDLAADSLFDQFQGGELQATATNGLVFAQAGLSHFTSAPGGVGVTHPSRIQLRLATGDLIGTREYPGREITGLTKAPLSWVFTDATEDEIVVIGPFGNEIASAPGVGASGGMHAIAYDTLTDHDATAQVPVEDGASIVPGSVNDPDAPWSPAPWLGRHRIYIANVPDQVIYAGYLTPDP
jgi:hypothetical protein